jgi:hypothetical protein
VEPIPLTPLRVGEIVAYGAAIYRDRSGDLVRAVAVVLLPLTAAQIVLGLLLLHQDGGLGYLAGLVSLLLAFAASQLATAACLQISAGAYVGLRPTWEESLTFGMARVRTLLALELLAELGVVVGIVLFVLPGLYLAAAWQLAIPVLLFEGLAGPAALGRSRRLLRGRVLPAFGLLMVLNVLSFLVTGIVQAVLVGLTGTSNDVLDLLVRGLGGMAASVVTLPLVAAATAVLYIQALVRHGEVDLPKLAARLGL